MEEKTQKKNWFLRHKYISGILILFLVIIIIGAMGSSGSSSTSSNSNSSSNTPAKIQKPTTAVRQVMGKETTLGAGNFVGGKDVPAGLYDATAPGQSGNFIVSGTNTYDEILGEGVTKIRAKISDGDKIELSSLSNVIFTPVSTPFVATHNLATLYSGTFIVGEDIGAGRYVATTAPGDSGNFIVNGSNYVDEILGQNGFGGVPKVTTDLSNGDVITISGLGEVTMTPQ